MECAGSPSTRHRKLICAFSIPLMPLSIPGAMSAAKDAPQSNREVYRSRATSGWKSLSTFSVLLIHQVATDVQCARISRKAED